MKNKNILIPIAAASLLFAACDDQVMQWKDPDSTVRPEELPLDLAEKISRYDFIKNYMAQYHPTVDITVGMGLDNFLSDEMYEQTVLDNFQGCTFGNALKHQSVISNSGAYNWTSIDRFLAKNTGLKIHGHNFLWHTQQNQNYLKSLIAPEMIVISDPDADIQNRLAGDESDFEGGTKGGWGSWGNSSSSDVVSPGRGDSEYCMHLSNPTDAEAYNAQCGLTFSAPLEPGTYKIRFYAKSDTPGATLQFQYQNSETYGSQGGYNTFEIGADWTLCEHEFELTLEDVDRILINFGKTAGNFYIDDIEFGLKLDVPSDPMQNVIFGDDSDFEGGTKGSWSSWGNDSQSSVTQPGYESDYCMLLENPKDGDDYYVAQAALTFDMPLAEGTYIVSFFAKSNTAAGSVQFCYQNSETYSGGGYHAFDVGTDWVPCEYEFSLDRDDINRILINFGKVTGNYYIDNVKFGLKNEEAESMSVRRASSISYKLKTPEEKREALLGAMENWIREATYHVGKYCSSYDVINEPIGDDISFRGVDGDKGRGWMSGDSKPVEDTATGLNLNWENSTGNGHFYWGYYLGMDYAVKAFEYARKYANEVNPDIKLFVNEYNLETSPQKLEKLIEFVEYIDNNGAHVDGIGTQMHVSGNSITKEQVDEMFKTLASTGKLIRITELDVAMGTATPSLEQQQTQADVYKMILTSFFENIPEAQQHGITIWSLTDGAKEHEYWLNGDTPNIFDANYGRKIAYKGVCDAIIGYDPSDEWESEDFSKSK